MDFEKLHLFLASYTAHQSNKGVNKGVSSSGLRFAFGSTDWRGSKASSPGSRDRPYASGSVVFITPVILSLTDF